MRALALAVACDLHPILNLRVQKYLAGRLADDTDRTAWYEHWIRVGFEGLEGMLAEHPMTGRFCHGDTPGLADALLVPQVYNAVRFDCDLSPFPTVSRINEECLALEAFDRARPETQPDAE